MLSRFAHRSSHVVTRGFFTIIPQYQRGVKLNFGKFVGVLEPGIRLNIPIYHSIYKADMRINTRDIEDQSMISSDNVTFYFDASVQYQIVDPKKALLGVGNLDASLVDRCKMQLRNVLSGMEVNDILNNREHVNTQLMCSMKDIADRWGVEISMLQIKDISFDDTMKRAMAVKAEADRNAEAKIINARADVETAKKYNEAAQIYAENPVTLRLREFQLWQSISKNPAASIYVVPSNLLDKLGDIKK